jgi:hypothetical protein
LLASGSRQIALSFEKVATPQTQDNTRQSVGSTSSTAQGAVSFFTIGRSALAGKSYIDRTLQRRRTLETTSRGIARVV